MESHKEELSWKTITQLTYCIEDLLCGELMAENYLNIGGGTECFAPRAKICAFQI
jgi:hypothetical protein